MVWTFLFLCAIIYTEVAPSSISFTSDLAFGQEAEKYVMSLLSGACVESPPRFLYDFVQMLPAGVKSWEVKCDRMYKKTGNVAVERSCNGKTSSIFSGIPDRVAYVLDNDVYCFETRNLVALCKKHGRIIRGGDGGRAEMYLVKADIIKKGADAHLS